MLVLKRVLLKLEPFFILFVFMNQHFLHEWLRNTLKFTGLSKIVL